MIKLREGCFISGAMRIRRGISKDNDSPTGLLISCEAS